MSWLNSPNSSPSVRSCLTAGIGASDRGVQAGRVRCRSCGARGPVAGIGVIVIPGAAVATAGLAAAPVYSFAVAVLPAPTLGALQKPRSDESGDERAAQHQCGL